MSASAGKPLRVAARALILALALALGGVGTEGQEVPPAPGDGQFPLNPVTRYNLTRLQIDWLDWLVACNEGDGERASAVLDRLEDHVRVIGMRHVPELGLAAAMRAVDFAAEGDLERASWGLEAAERLAPGRPEAAFAAARVALANGDYAAAAGRHFVGLYRGFTEPSVRYVLLNNLGLWLASVVTLAGLLLVGVLMISRGPELYFDLYRYFNRYLPVIAAHLLCLVLLGWPLLLPAGLLWTAIYWSVLLWAYGRRLEKALLIGLWLFVGSLPALLAEQERRVGLALYPPVQSIEGAARGDLHGDLFNHLALLQSSLPESAARRHYSADIHRKLRQMEASRSLYREVLADEPDNTTALNDLGIYYFEASDFEEALAYFERAAESDPEAAEIQFNLGQAYSELYRFEESERALFAARGIDSDAVDLWLKRGLVERVIAMNGGLARVDEIRSELRAQWLVAEEGPGWVGYLRRALSLPLVSVFVIIAIVARLGTRRGRSAKPQLVWGGPLFDRVRRVVLAGVPEAENGRPGRALASLLLVVGLATLPWAHRLGYGQPWLDADAPGVLPVVSVLGLILYFGARYLSYWRGEG